MNHDHSGLPEKRAYIAVIERIRDLIRSGDLEPGNKLPPERRLAQELGVSRNSIRQAIQALTERKLLESRQGDGTYLVPHPTSTFACDAIIDAINEQRGLLTDILEFRQILEPQLAALAARRILPEEIARLKVVICDQQMTLMAGGDSTVHDTEFHLKLADYSGNRVVAQVMRTLRSILDETRSPWLQSMERRNASVEGHLRIIEALASGNPEAAAAAMNSHLLNVEHHIFGEESEASPS